MAWGNFKVEEQRLKAILAFESGLYSITSLETQKPDISLSIYKGLSSKCKRCW